jgi:hypothetical protein
MPGGLVLDGCFIMTQRKEPYTFCAHFTYYLNKRTEKAFNQHDVLKKLDKALVLRQWLYSASRDNCKPMLYTKGKTWHRQIETNYFKAVGAGWKLCFWRGV